MQIKHPKAKINLSPLRYPGGKANLSKFLTSVININNCVGCHYYEPFAGGAGAALCLLTGEIVSELYLNDADPSIYSFWRSALSKTDQFVDRILKVPLTIEEWHLQKSIYLRPKRHSIFDIGFATFYLNRCNRSGILVGAGPIGGGSQKGSWRLDARFNRDNLASRVLELGKYRKVIHIFNLDALTFLSTKVPRDKSRQEAFVYLDPPYFSAGQRLYLNFYRVKDHLALSRYILRQRILKWLISYDNNEFLRRLYHPCKTFVYLSRYSLQKKQKAEELLIAPNYMTIPNNNELSQLNMDIKRIKLNKKGSKTIKVA